MLTVFGALNYEAALTNRYTVLATLILLFASIVGYLFRKQIYDWHCRSWHICRKGKIEGQTILFTNVTPTNFLADRMLTDCAIQVTKGIFKSLRAKVCNLSDFGNETFEGDIGGAATFKTSSKTIPVKTLHIGLGFREVEHAPLINYEFSSGAKEFAKIYFPAKQLDELELSPALLDSYNNWTSNSFTDPRFRNLPFKVQVQIEQKEVWVVLTSHYRLSLSKYSKKPIMGPFGVVERFTYTNPEERSVRLKETILKIVPKMPTYLIKYDWEIDCDIVVREMEFQGEMLRYPAEFQKYDENPTPIENLVFESPIFSHAD